MVKEIGKHEKKQGAVVPRPDKPFQFLINKTDHQSTIPRQFSPGVHEAYPGSHEGLYFSCAVKTFPRCEMQPKDVNPSGSPTL